MWPVVALVGLADVEELDGVVGEELLELLERDGAEALLAAAFLPAGEVEDRHRRERARRAKRFGLVGRVDDERPLRQDECRSRREVRAARSGSRRRRAGVRPRTSAVGRTSRTIASSGRRADARERRAARRGTGRG